METLSYDGSLVLPSLVLAMNAIFAALIVGRLIYHQRKLGARSSSQYTSIATMIIESAGLNIVFQTLALGSTKNIVLNSLFNFNLLGQIQASSSHSVAGFQSANDFSTGVCDALNHLPGRAREGTG